MTRPGDLVVNSEGDAEVITHMFEEVPHVNMEGDVPRLMVQDSESAMCNTAWEVSGDGEGDWCPFILRVDGSEQFIPRGCVPTARVGDMVAVGFPDGDGIRVGCLVDAPFVGEDGHFLYRVVFFDNGEYEVVPTWLCNVVNIKEFATG